MKKVSPVEQAEPGAGPEAAPVGGQRRAGRRRSGRATTGRTAGTRPAAPGRRATAAASAHHRPAGGAARSRPAAVAARTGCLATSTMPAIVPDQAGRPATPEPTRHEPAVPGGCRPAGRDDGSGRGVCAAPRLPGPPGRWQMRTSPPSDRPGRAGCPPRSLSTGRTVPPARGTCSTQLQVHAVAAADRRRSPAPTHWTWHDRPTHRGATPSGQQALHEGVRKPPTEKDPLTVRGDGRVAVNRSPNESPRPTACRSGVFSACVDPASRPAGQHGRRSKRPAAAARMVGGEQARRREHIVAVDDDRRGRGAAPSRRRGRPAPRPGSPRRAAARAAAPHRTRPRSRTRRRSPAAAACRRRDRRGRAGAATWPRAAAIAAGRVSVAGRNAGSAARGRGGRRAVGLVRRRAAARPRPPRPRRARSSRMPEVALDRAAAPQRAGHLARGRRSSGSGVSTE